MKPVWTLGQIVSQLTNWEARWDNQAPIAYAFYTQPHSFLSINVNFSPFSALQRQALARHMELVSDVCTLTFTNVADNGQPPGQSNQRIGFYNVNHQNVPFWGVAMDFVTDSEDAPYGRMYGANSAVNLYRANSQGGWSIGDSNPRKLMHELLHTIGLDHAGTYNGDSANYENEALFFQDSHQYTVMSYWLAAATGADHEASGTLYHASTPLLYDVAALQHLYGANMTTRTGNNVYGFNANAGREVYDLQAHPNAVFTIWDARGNDTLDLSGYATPARIDLHEGAFTDAGNLTGNISIAHGATIENAVGGSGSDVLIGNNASNRLTGGGGGDIFTFTEGDAQPAWRRADGKKGLPDLIADFVPGEDRIDLSAIDAVRGTAANDAFSFIGSAAFSRVSGELRAVLVEGRMQIFGDTDGNGVADIHILTASTIIQAGDFVL
ncbi:MAG TPA: M10 family metallopeptidase C-terminal domain-containing protein [Allosphingosinicella sp.]|nr:M10 family metallopeptidase C-terminal domain-containing protein [Allosphingosinicella sp.]